MILKIVWRNLWRNRRRTFITMASIFFAVILAVLMRSMQLGTYDRMIRNIAGFYTGYIQIHQKGYWDEQTLEKSFIENDTIINELNENRYISVWVPRLESFALCSGDEATRGLRIVGTDPDKENLMSALQSKIIEGNYFDAAAKEVLLAEGAAKHLKLGVGDTLVIIGQGFHGISAAAKYPVKGIISFPTDQLNDNMVYLPLKEAQLLFGAENRLTSIAVMLINNDVLATTKNKLNNNIDDHYEVMDWKQLTPELAQAIQGDNSGGIIMLAVLFLIIAFGVFGTVLMMLNERRREFAILIAIGMKKAKLGLIVVLETVLISLIGSLTGMLASLPVIEYFKFNPIKITGDIAEAYAKWGFEPVMAFTDKASIFLWMAFLVLIVALLISIYPWFKIKNMNMMQAMRS